MFSHTSEGIRLWQGRQPTHGENCSNMEVFEISEQWNLNPRVRVWPSSFPRVETTLSSNIYIYYYRNLLIIKMVWTKALCPTKHCRGFVETPPELVTSILTSVLQDLLMRQLLHKAWLIQNVRDTTQRLFNGFSRPSHKNARIYTRNKISLLTVGYVNYINILWFTELTSSFHSRC